MNLAKLVSGHAEGDDESKDCARPPFSADDALAHLASLWGLKDVSVSELPSYDDRNFKVMNTDGDATHVLKFNATSNEGEAASVDLENEMFKRLDRSPKLVSTLDGKSGGSITRAGVTYAVRLITFIQGPLMAEVAQSNELLFDLGATIAGVAKSLEGFDHAGAHREGFLWDLQFANVAKPNLEHIDDPVYKTLCEKAYRDWETGIIPSVAKLPMGLIHNDLNDYNAIAAVDGSRVAAVLDFGDVVHTHLVNDVAIALAYFLMGKADILASAICVLRGYHSVRPLVEAEVEVLFPLIRLRISTTIANAAKKQVADPGNSAYTNVHALPGRKLLQVLSEPPYSNPDIAATLWAALNE